MGRRGGGGFESKLHQQKQNMPMIKKHIPEISVFILRQSQTCLENYQMCAKQPNIRVLKTTNRVLKIGFILFMPEYQQQHFQNTQKMHSKNTQNNTKLSKRVLEIQNQGCYL